MAAPDTGPASFNGAHNLAVNSKGDLFITETYEGKRVQKFSWVQQEQPEHVSTLIVQFLQTDAVKSRS